MVLNLSYTTSSGHTETTSQTTPRSPIKVVALLAIAAFSTVLVARAFKRSNRIEPKAEIPPPPLHADRALSLATDLKGRLKSSIESGLAALRQPLTPEALTALAGDVQTMSDSVNAFLDQSKTVRSHSRSSSSSMPSYVSVHELRTPLQNLYILLSQEESERLPSFLMDLQTNYQTLLRLLEDVPDDATQNSEMSIQLAPFSLDQLCNQVDTQTKIYAKKHGVTVQFSIPKGGVKLVGDSHRLWQILCNLITNAVKYSGCQVIDVVITIDAGQVRFKVIDHGKGISKEGQEKLFRPFSQLEEGKSAVPSSGVGLFFCKSVVELMNDGKQGVIGVTSPVPVVGQGSEFWFTIPCIAVPASPRVAAGPTELNDKSLKILAADDQSIMLRLYERALNLPKADQASDGQSAMKKIHTAIAEGKPYRVVLLDVAMPNPNGEQTGVGGVETAKAIQEIAAEHLPYIIFVSGLAEEEVRALLEKYEVSMHNISILTKSPIDKVQLIATVRLGANSS